MCRRETQLKVVHAARAIGLVTALSVLLPGLAYAQAKPIITEAPVALIPLVGPCTGEPIVLTGRLLTATYVRTSGAGVHSTVRAILKLKGTTADLVNPKQYVLNDENLIEFNDVAAYEQTVEFNSVVVRQGESGDPLDVGGVVGDDLKASTRMHFTKNALGVFTADFFTITFTCM